MLQQITVRVELGSYVMRGREVEFLEVRQRVGAHTECTLAFARDPKAVASSVAPLRLAELAGASVRVVFVVDRTQEYLAFAGTVRDAEIEHLASGAGEVSVTALSDSHVLDEHVDRRYFREHGPGALAQTFGLGVAGTLPAGDVRDYVQAGVSAWTFLNQVVAGEGLQLRPVWPRTPDESADYPAEIGQGFAEELHVLTWGRELIRFATALAPVNAGVTGAFYEPATKHDHRFRGVRATVGWLGGAKPVVSAAESVATSDADGGDPGHVEGGWQGGTRARTLTEFRTRMELASARRLGSAVRGRGVSVDPALRAGDQVRIDPAPGLVAADDESAGPQPLDEHVGTFGLVQVTHRWNGTLYENQFEATPWSEFHLPPTLSSGEHGAPQTIALGVVVSVTDPKGLGRIKVRYGWMEEGEATHWVRVAGLGGGNGRGVGVLPSVGDEVVVAAVGGDPEHPVVLGALWSGVDRAGHAPGRQHWVTPAGNTLSFVEGKAGADEEKVELYSKTGACWVQLAAKGPTGVPTVTVHSEGDLAIEAPKGELRITAKSMATFVETDAKREVKGAVHDKITGPVTVVSQAQLALRGGTTVVLADGALRAHAGGTHTVTGQLVTLNPNGAAAPQVTAQAPEKKPSAWGARPVPGPGPGRSTQDPRTPTQRELAKKAQTASMLAAPVAVAPSGAAPVVAASAIAGSAVAAPAAALAASVRAAKALPGGTCGGGWGAVDAERDNILKSGGPTDNAIQRNRQISAAYAQYYQRNPSNEWAGVASIVSRQARCAMEQARDTMGPITYDYYYRELPEAAAQPTPRPPLVQPPTPGLGGLTAMVAYDALAKANKGILSDLYPVLRFEEDYGGDALNRCGAARPGGPVDPAVQQAMRQMRSPDADVRTLAGGALANYEQRKILQDQVLNNGLTRQAFDVNQFMADSSVGRLLGARKPEVALTAGCDDGTPTLPFTGQFTDPNARVNYYNTQVAPAFRQLDPKQLSGIIGTIAGGR